MNKLMKKRNLILIVLLVIVGTANIAFAQKKKKDDKKTSNVSSTITNPFDTTKTNVSTESPVQNQEQTQRQATPKEERLMILQGIYETAINYYDVDEAKHALYEMIVLLPEYPSLKDTLALLYYNQSKFGSAIAVANEILAVDRNRYDMLELRAISNENLRFYNEALRDYEKLYLNSQNLGLLYKMAILQYNTKRYEECKTNIDIIMSSKDSEGLSINVNKNQYEEQRIPIRAGALNLKGLVYLDQGKKDIAVQSFQQALKLAPDFVMAKGNLASATAPKK